MKGAKFVNVEFLSTFRYRAHQVAVVEQEDKKLQPDFEFSICGQHLEMLIERFDMLLGVYYELEIVTNAFTQGLTQGEDGVMRAWWPQISTTMFRSHRGMQSCTLFCIVLRLFLSPSGARLHANTPREATCQNVACMKNSPSRRTAPCQTLASGALPRTQNSFISCKSPEFEDFLREFISR
ncbi:hypothetical protein R6Q57_001612 [Mikania cordata]